MYVHSHTHRNPKTYTRDTIAYRMRPSIDTYVHLCVYIYISSFMNALLEHTSGTYASTYNTNGQTNDDALKIQ